MAVFTHEEIERILKNIRSQNMMAQFVEKKEDVLPAVKALLKEGDVVCNGGSMTLGQTGVLEMLKTSPAYEYLDISGDKTEEEKEELLRRRFTADVLRRGASLPELEAFDRWMIERHRSPGGSADLLGLCWLLHFRKEEKIIDNYSC